MASMSQLLNLRDNELDILAKFLGHDIRVHREFYRLPQNTLEIARVGKLLMAMNEGNLDKYTGKSLDEINPLESEYRALAVCID